MVMEKQPLCKSKRGETREDWQENCKVVGQGGTVILSEVKDLVGISGLV